MALQEAKTIYLTRNTAFTDMGFGFGSTDAVALNNDKIDREKLLEKSIESANKFGNDFTVFYSQDEQPIVFRGRRIQSSKGEMFVLREILKGVPDLDSNILSLPSYFKAVVSEHFLLKGGLFFICGSTGNGKTTTLIASMVHRLIHFGGMAISIEDPPEYQLTGKVGRGLCIQMPVCKENGGDFSGAIKAALRCYPSRQPSTIMSIGEIRDPQTAVKVLQDALNGHLVFTTVHANNLISGISRIVTLASKELGIKEALNLMSMALKVGVYQEINAGKPRIKMLINNGTNTKVSGTIAQGALKTLNSEITRQNNLLKRNIIPIDEQ